jgi:hypothetical protein
MVWQGGKVKDFDVAIFNADQNLWLIEGIYVCESDSITHGAPVIGPSKSLKIN